MSDDASGSDGASGDTDGWDAATEPPSGSTPRVADPVPHSRLVGLMAAPVSRSVPFRRSTVLMLVAFLGFGTLTYLYPPNSSTISSPAGTGGIPGTFIPLTTPSPHPTTTTTTSRPGGPEATTTSTTTTTTRPTSTSTTTTNAPVTTTTTTTSGGSTTTTSASTSTTTTAP